MITPSVFDAPRGGVRSPMAFLAAGLAVAVAVSIARAAWAGGLDLVAFEADYARHFLFSLLAGGPLAVAAWAHLELHRTAQAGGPDAVPLARLRDAALAIQCIAALALPLTSADVFGNLAFGTLAASGLNPHAYPPSALGAGSPFVEHMAVPWRPFPSPYGPLITPLQAIAGSAGSLVVALVTFKLEMLAIAIAVVLAAHAFARRHRQGPEGAAGFAAIALCPLLAWEVSGQAHNDGLLVLLLLAFVWAVTAERAWLAFAFVLAACCAKYVAAPVLAIHLAYVWRRSPRRAVGMAVIAGVVLLAALHPYYHQGPQIPSSLTYTTGAKHHTRSLTSLACWLVAPLGDRAAAIAYWVGWGIAVVATAALTLRGALRAIGPEAVIHGGLVVLMTCCILAPWGQAWYATWLLPFLLAERDRGWQRIGVVYTALSLAQYALLIDPVSYAIVDGVPLWLAWQHVRGRTRDPQSPRASMRSEGL